MSQEDFCGSAPELEPKWNLQAEVLSNLCAPRGNPHQVVLAMTKLPGIPLDFWPGS